jgi:hypothetical protein
MLSGTRLVFSMEKKTTFFSGGNLFSTSLAGSSKISELTFEQTMEELERQSWANMQTLLKTEEFLGIEYDENVICDVCRGVRWSSNANFRSLMKKEIFSHSVGVFSYECSRIQKKAMKWFSAIVAIFAFIKPATVF